MRKRKGLVLADVPVGSENPLNKAVTNRDAGVVDMVADAIRHNEIRMAFQPVMQARPPHQVAFYEGFVRVLDSTGRVIPAAQFMPQINETELARDIDCKALELGLRTLTQNPGIRLSVNLSARSIGYNRWQNILDRKLKNDPEIGERLLLEVEESSALAVPELLANFIDRLQGRGIAFALDDFGSGSLSIAKLREFFFDGVKIDGQFVRGVHADLDKQDIVGALIDLANRFDMLTIAESVETLADAEFMVKAGIDCLQGYLFGAPSVRPPWLRSTLARKTA
jgi:EAL domain-containing protein (putative c-di-GMP-specific phosphodiesterase class I)